MMKVEHKYNLQDMKEMADQYFFESFSEHDRAPMEEEKCKGCRKMRMASDMLRFIEEFEGS